MAVCTSSVRMKDGHLSTPEQGQRGRRCTCALMGVRGGKQKVILARYANPADAKGQCVFLTVYRQEHYLPSLLKCQQQACTIMNMLIISVYGVIRWKANLQAPAYSALECSQRPLVAVLLNSLASSLSKYQNKSGFICSDAEQVLLSHFLSTSQFHFLPNSCVQVTRVCCEVGP